MYPRSDLVSLGAGRVGAVPVDAGIDPGSEFSQGGEGVAVVVLVFEDRPERFSGGVVVTRSGSAH